MVFYLFTLVQRNNLTKIPMRSPHCHCLRSKYYGQFSIYGWVSSTQNTAIYLEKIFHFKKVQLNSKWLYIFIAVRNVQCMMPKTTPGQFVLHTQKLNRISCLTCIKLLLASTKFEWLCFSASSSLQNIILIQVVWRTETILIFLFSVILSN